MINLIKSTFYNEQDTKQKLADFILNAKILSMGAECRRFEESFALKQGRKQALFVGSGSAANLSLIQALLNLGRLKKGDKIGVSSLTWATNIMPLIQLGLVPIALDCEVETLNVSPRILQERIKDIKALFLTNVLGFCDNLTEIKRICEDNNVILLEDNCESLGSKYKGTLLGNFGLASTFSFFVGHHISAIEGGMVCTDDEELYDMLLMVRAHGWDRNLDKEKQEKIREDNNIDDFFSRYTFYDLAYNTRPNEINGFLGNIQINYWDNIVSSRETNFKKIDEIIKNNPDLIHLKTDNMDIVSNFSIPIICKDKSTFEKYKAKFQEAEIEIRPIIAGDMTKQPFYKKYVEVIDDCPNAQLVHTQGFYCGNNPDLTEDELNLFCKLLKSE